MSVRDCLKDIESYTRSNLDPAHEQSYQEIRDCIHQFCASLPSPNNERSAQFTSEDVADTKLPLEQWRSLMANVFDAVIGLQGRCPSAWGRLLSRETHDHMHGCNPSNFEQPETLFRKSPFANRILTPFADYLTVIECLRLLPQEESVTLSTMMWREHVWWDIVDVIDLHYCLKFWERTSHNFSALLEWNDSPLQSLLDARLTNTWDTEEAKRMRSKIQIIQDDLCFKLAKTRGIVPSTFYIKGVNQWGDHPIGRGGFAEVWLGHYKDLNVESSHQAMLALKVLTYRQININNGKHLDVLKALCREAVLWKRTNHPNVLKFIGICHLDSKDSVEPRLALVSPRMTNGALISYATRCEGVDRPTLLAQIAHGLIYLHSVDIVHGDLKCSNVLVDDEGVAQLADFGLSSVGNISENLTSSLSGSAGTGNPRWLAPELMIPEQFNASGKPSFESDVYAFAMTALELFTEQKPFFGFLDPAVFVEVIKGHRPPRPGAEADNRGLTNDIWGFMEKCWHHERFSRPKTRVQNISDLLEFSMFSATELHLRCYVPSLGFNHNTPPVTGQVRKVFPENKGWLKNVIGLTIERTLAKPRRFRRISQCLHLDDERTEEFESSTCSNAGKCPRGDGYPVTCRVLKNTSTQVFDYKHVFDRYCNVEFRITNVAPFIGYCEILSPFKLKTGLIFDLDRHHVALVLDYISETKTIDRLGIIEGISNGLSYLHRLNIVHGDLRSANIVVEKGIVRLVDYGIPTRYREDTECMERKVFLAPEILPFHSGVEEQPTKESDMYSLAMTFYEILTEQIPFSDIKLPEKELLDDIATKKLRPRYPSIIADRRGLSISLWGLMTSCWEADANARPTAALVLRDVKFERATRKHSANLMLRSTTRVDFTEAP